MDDSKNATLVAVMVFCLVVIFFQLLFNMGDSFGWLKMFGGLILATAAGAGTFVAMGAMKK
jgi:hypothetical protein